MAHNCTARSGDVWFRVTSFMFAVDIDAFINILLCLRLQFKLFADRPKQSGSVKRENAKIVAVLTHGQCCCCFCDSWIHWSRLFNDILDCMSLQYYLERVELIRAGRSDHALTHSLIRRCAAVLGDINRCQPAATCSNQAQTPAVFATMWLWFHCAHIN